MMGKVKLKKYMVKEIVMKIDMVMMNCGGGKVGVIDCKVLDKGGYVKLVCLICKVMVLDVKSMLIYYEVKYLKLLWEEDKFINLYVMVLIVEDKFKFGV